MLRKNKPRRIIKAMIILHLHMSEAAVGYDHSVAEANRNDAQASREKIRPVI
jgi:hypothetical protein